MKQEIYIIGCGMGGRDTLTIEAERAIQSCGLLIGAPRLLESHDAAKQACIRNEEILETIHRSSEQKIGVLVSGDPGFFSAAKKLTDKLGAYEVRVICGISSLSYFCAKLRTSWDDAYVVSAHGRDAANIAAAVMANAKTFILTGGENSVSAICKQLAGGGLGGLQVTVGENLSYENESIVRAGAAELAGRDFDSLSVMLVENPEDGI